MNNLPQSDTLGCTAVVLRSNRDEPITLYEEVVKRLSYTDVYEPMNLTVSEIREMLAPHFNHTFEYKEFNDTTVVHMANEHMAVLSLPDGRSIILNGDNTVDSIMNRDIATGGDADKAADTTLRLVRALRALVAISVKPIEMSNEYFVYGEDWLHDMVLAGLDNKDCITNLNLTGKDLLTRLHTLNCHAEYVVTNNDNIRIAKITGGGPDRVLISYELGYGVEVNNDVTIIKALAEQIRFAPDAAVIIKAGVKIATHLNVKLSGQPRPIVNVPEVITKG